MASAGIAAFLVLLYDTCEHLGLCRTDVELPGYVVGWVAFQKHLARRRESVLLLRRHLGRNPLRW